MKLFKTCLALQIFLLVFLCIFIPACDVSFNKPAVSEQDGMVLVHIGFSEKLERSVMPNVPSRESITFLDLYGTSSTDSDAQEILLGKFKGNLDGASVLLKPGRWNFTLEGYNSNDYPVLRGCRKGVDISMGYSATVHFSIIPIIDSNYEGTASIVIELPDNIGINMVETTIDGVTLEPPLEIRDGTIMFYSIMPAGDYLVHFFLKDIAGRALAVITEMLVIRGGLESEKTIVLAEDDLNSPPASPSNFRVTSFTEGNLVFAWQRNSWNETGFILNDGTTDYPINAVLTDFILADSNPIGKTFTICAVNDFGESSRSEYKVDLPITPTGVAAEALSPNEIKVSWQAVDGASTYTVQRAVDSDGPFTNIDTIADTVFIDTQLSFSTIYHYRVIANNMFGNGSASDVVSAQTMPLFGSEDNPFQLTADIWAGGNIDTTGGMQWFTFYATSGAQYIHTDFNTLSDIYIQMYDYSGNAVGSEIRLSGNTRSISLMLTIGQQYYIRVRPYSADESGAYRISFNTSIVPPVIVLTENVWANGYIVPSVGEQWFTFTATVQTQYIHVEFGTLTDLYVRVDSGDAVGSETRFNGGMISVSRSLVIGQQYSIRVRPYSSGGSGAYRIAFNTSILPPDVNVTALIANTWADGNIALAGGVQWFTFTATAQTQLIHVEFGALTDLYVQVYENSGNAAGSETRFTGGTSSISRSLTVGQQYYIRVRPYSGSGVYRIAFNTSILPPNVTATTLTANTFANGNIASTGGTQWFIFTATAATQYIHVEVGTLAPVNVNVYEYGGNAVGSESALSGATTSITRTLTSGQQYYIRARASSGSGTYRITFNTSFAPPNVTMLTANNWTNGNIAANGSQWFRFTATAETQYFHIDFGTLMDMNVYMYDNSGTSVPEFVYIWETNINRVNPNTTSYSRSVTVGQQYYVQVCPYSVGDSGTYRITFNTSIVPPGAVVLTANTWTDGYIAEGGGPKWFAFTATAASQYIHTTSNNRYLYVQVYDNNGNVIGNEESRLNMFFSCSVTSGQQYYVRVMQEYYSDGDGELFKIAFNTTPAPPGTITLTTNTWADGNIEAERGAQWFRFTATAATQYIHVEFGTLSSFSVTIYNSSGNAVGSETALSGGTTCITRTLTTGQQYYIRVMSLWDYGLTGGISGYSTGTYRIGFNASVVPPGVTVTALAANTWVDGNLPSVDAEQWFRFTATSGTQYIHFDFSGTLSNSYFFGVGVYDNSTNAYVESNILNNTSLSLSYSVTTGRQYIVMVRTSSGSGGTYRIAFNATSTPPAIILPQTGVTTLTSNTWANGNIPSANGTQWFRFNANAARQFIHLDFSTPYSLDVQVYNNSGVLTNGERINFSNTASINSSLSSGQQYYIRVRMMGSAVGTYRIMFNTSVVSPIATVTTLTANTWVDVTGGMSQRQWFSFTATSNTQYIHAKFINASGSIYAQVYDNSSNAVGSEIELWASSNYISPSLTLTVGQRYYIRAWRNSYYSSSGRMAMAFNASDTPPP